jgi:putative ABC transport system permease protein
VAYSLLRSAAARRFPALYVATTAVPMRTMFVMVRAPAPDVGARVIRKEVEHLDASLPVYLVRSSDEVLAYWFGPIHADALLSGALATVGGLLTVIGIYSVVAVFVTQRLREVGVRIAMGARPGDIVRLVVRRTLAPALFGGAAGVVGAFLASHVTASMLYDTSPLDPRAFLGAGGLLVVLVLGAAAMPAVRAAQTHPRVALASE